MIDVRPSQIRACGMAAIFLLSLVWPTTSMVRTEAPVSAATPDAVGLSASSLWLAPTSLSITRKSAIAAAVEDLADGKAARALPVLEQAAHEQKLGGYAALYLGRAELALDRLNDARATAARLLAAPAEGYLGEASLWFSADVAEAAEDWPAAVAALRALASGKPLEPERANLRLGRAAIKAGDPALALKTLNKLFYESPLSPEASDAAIDLAKLSPPTSPPSPDEFLRRLDRARALFGGKRYSDARADFALLQPWAAGDDRAMVDVGIAECDYHLKRYAAARDELLPLTAPSSPQRIEAEFFYFSTLRELGRRDEYVTRARAFVDAHPDHPLAEETLNNLATHYVLASDDEQAAVTLGELYSRFPTGPHANRAAWRTGWWKYKAGEYGEAARIFESAAAAFPHDDYRPSWLYWAARAHQRQGERAAAIDAFRQVVADYRNSYYGRQAARALAPLVPGFGQVTTVGLTLPMLTPGTPPPNADIIRDLLAAGLYDTAILEVRKAQLEFGTTPMLDATIAYALNRKGDLRGAIIRMRRAYPQFLVDGGEALPQEIRRVIFPIAYWNLISRYAVARNLDPYLMTALVAQESTFQSEVKSSAGAWGLMQIEPGTGRRYAPSLNIRPFSTAKLKQPEVNVQIGMAVFSDSLAKYGSVAPALAAYNAGDSRVTRWLSERRGFEQDEFIDDIPFPETQNYVKRVIGTAEDYRGLYGALTPVERLDAEVAVGAAKPVAQKVTAAPKSVPKGTASKASAKAPVKKKGTPARPHHK
jgi:soluble lytic murein transglycosylase